MPTSWAIIFSEGFAPRQKHYNILFMESRNISLTTSEEGFISSSRDRKAVYDDTDNFIGLTGGTPSVSYPLYNLIPEIITEENLLSSFKRVLSNLSQSSTEAEKGTLS